MGDSHRPLATRFQVLGGSDRPSPLNSLAHRPSTRCVYNMRMSRINVYLPDDLAEEAKKAGLNISSLTQEAIRSALAARTLGRWQQQVSELRSPGVSHDKVLEAVKSAKDDLENG